ncbi:MAG: carboxypeptidase regulatory-like domain-containing protein [Blastocatellia bacterium]|nr:carboxypeptidase regulatory-like domain-containing protein [Blastocatellia bacterium]
MSSKRNPLALGRRALEAALLLLCVGFLMGAPAQTNTVGSISGAVRDPAGAVVPKVEVVIQEERTGFSRTVKTNTDGDYSALSLPIGLYTVSTAPDGFKKTVASGLELHVGENLVVNLTLEVGQVNETVTVTSGTVTVETRSGNVSSLIAEKQVTELPLNGRNYSQLALMVPGVSPEYRQGAGGAFASTGTGLNGGVDMSVNGNGSNQNMWTVDGVNNMDVGSNRTLLVFPSIDSIQEFRVERNSFSAEFGQAQGAVINLVTKGGSNEFHGALFEFLRNDALNATDFFLNRAGQDKAPLRYNNFGGNFSGPIIKDRVFFFWSEEWRRTRRGFTLGARVPTAAEKTGDFSGPLTSALPRDPDTGQPFPGNRIPQNRLSPAGLAILQVYPDPTTTASGNNWIASPLQPINTRQDSIRGDINITNNMNLMVRWINEYWVHERASGNFWGDAPFPTLSSDWEQPSESFAVKLAMTLSSTAVNEFQFSRAGNDIIINTNAAGEALNSEIASKFPSVFPREEGVGLPTLWAADGYAALWHQAPWTNHEDLFIWKDDFSKVVRSHDLKFGALFSHNIKDETNVGANEVAQLCGTNNRTGNAIADLLVRDLPLGCYIERDHRESALGRWRDFEFYGTDTWKARPGITLTMGLRWSRYSPPYSKNDRITNFVPSLYDGQNFQSGLIQAGQGGLPRSFAEPYNAGFQPRLGIAWDIFGDGRTALRLGFGRFLSRTNVIEDILRLSGNPPWTVQVSSNGPGVDSRLPDDPTFRSLDTINPGLAGNVAGVGANSPFNAVSIDFRPPESYQWNATISREIMKDTIVEISYVGNHGLHIWRRGVNFNEVVPSARLAVAERIRNGQGADDIINANRRLPGLGPITLSESTGDSSYHGMQVWVNRRFSGRLAFQASYSWGHAITNVPLTSFTSATTDPFNYDLDRGDADLDRRHMFVFNVVYSLPSFVSWGRLANHILGDWQVNTIASFLDGPPIEINSGANTAGLGTAPAATGFRPDLVPGVPIFLNTGDPTQYLNPAAFALPALGQFGNLGRGAIRQPAIENIDFSVAKNWKVTERYGLQFRAEMFNVFNHVNFSGFDTTLNFQNVRTDPNFGNPTNPNFGRLTGNRGPREIQFGLKFSF